MVLAETSTEYELQIPVVAAPNIPDDPYIETFVDGFRQYPHGRSSLAVDFDTIDPALLRGVRS